jgi:UDP-glucose 4-epimerase
MSAIEVAVTGANGFIGSHLLDTLAQQGWSTRCLDRTDLQDLARESLEPKALEGCQAVIHLAARAHITDGSETGRLDLYRPINRDLTLALARLAVEAGVKRFVFVSSIGVNGPHTERPFRADDIPAPAEAYAISKLEAERSLMELARETGLEVVIVRPPLVYGPDAKGNFARLMNLVHSGLPLPLASVKARRSFVSVWNLCDLLALCAVHPAAVGQVLLVSDDEDIALPDLIRELAQAMGRPCRLFPVPIGALRFAARLIGKGDMIDKLVAPLCVDSEPTRRLLAWQPPVSLREGLARTALYLLR